MTLIAAAKPLPTLLSLNILEPLRWEAIFSPERAANLVALDLGAGDGGFALAYAKLRPELNILAVERLLGRARKIARKADRNGLPNLRALRLETAYVVERLCPPASIDEMHLLFPDPWPKRRHWERRILQVPFLETAARALKPGGVFRFVTDHVDYFAHGLEVFAAPSSCEQFERVEGEPFPYPHTDFESGFRAEGKPINGGVWRRL